MSLGSILAMVSGLGLFLYGMKMMSDGLQKVAGARLRMILEKLTKNRFMGVIIGFLFTAIVQSSSATTVLVVSFVDTGLMNLTQSVGVIMGANIGTTMTGQLIAFKLTAIAPVILMAGVIMLIFMKKPMIQKTGEVLLGFGMLFVGLETMSGSMEMLRESPQVNEVISSLANPYLAILVGLLVTAVLQSSSATTGIVMLMAGQGLVSLHMSFYLILGCNMGSCVSALIASLAGDKNAKRAAMVHFLFNLFGSALVVVALGFFGNEIQHFIEGLSSSTVLADYAPTDVANANTIFKLSQVLILFPFANGLVKLSKFIVRGKDSSEEQPKLPFIGDGHAVSPSTAVPLAISEIERMGRLANENLQRAMRTLMEGKSDELPKVYETEKEIDYLNAEICNYLVRVNQLSLPLQDKKILGGLFHVVNDIERIGDHAENIAEFAKVCIDKHLTFSKKAQEELQVMLGKVLQLLDYAIEMFSQDKLDHMQAILDLEGEIDKLERKLQKKHVGRLTKNKCEPHAAMIFTDLLSNLERVADHGTNIAFSIVEDAEEEN